MVENTDRDLAILMIPCMDGRLVESMLVLTDAAASAQEKKERLKEFIEERSTTYEKVCKVIDRVEELVSMVPGRKVKYVVASNAGGNVIGLELTLPEIAAQYEIMGVINITHNKCGGMGEVEKLMKSNAAESDEECSHFGLEEYKRSVSDATKSGKELREAIESENERIQCNRAGKMFKNVIGLDVNVSDLILKEHAPNETKYFMTANWTDNYAKVVKDAPIGSVYPILANAKDNFWDVTVAKSLGLVQFVTKKRPIKSA